MTKIIIQLSNGNYVCYDLIATKFKSCAIVFNSYKYCLEFINLIENSGPLLYEDEDFICHQCGNEYADCPCPGPTMDDEYEYKEEGGELYARKLLGGE